MLDFAYFSEVTYMIASSDWDKNGILLKRIELLHVLLRASDKIAILRLFHYADGNDGDNDDITHFFYAYIFVTLHYLSLIGPLLYNLNKVFDISIYYVRSISSRPFTIIISVK